MNNPTSRMEHINTQAELVHYLSGIANTQLDSSDIEQIKECMRRVTPNLRNRELDEYMAALPLWFGVSYTNTLQDSSTNNLKVSPHE